MPLSPLGETIREARLARFKLREFARILDVSPTHLSDVENGRRVPSEELLTQIATHLELDLDQLLAAAGRVPEDTRRFIENNPQAISLFRKVSTLDSRQLEQLEKEADLLVREKGEGD